MDIHLIQKVVTGSWKVWYFTEQNSKRKSIFEQANQKPLFDFKNVTLLRVYTATTCIFVAGRLR